MLEKELVRLFPKNWLIDRATEKFYFIGYEVPLIWDRKGRHQITDMLFESKDEKQCIVVEAKSKATMHVLPQILEYRKTLLGRYEKVISVILTETVSSDLYQFVELVGEELELYLVVLNEDGETWSFAHYG